MLGAPGTSLAQIRAEVAIGAADIGGRVTGPNGPEAGVWVIAETTDLPTKYRQDRSSPTTAASFVIPAASHRRIYKIWVRGYGLVDSDKQDVAPGKTLDLKAKPAPNAAAAAEYYPGMYWYSMLKIPAGQANFRARTRARPACRPA